MAKPQKPVSTAPSKPKPDVPQAPTSEEVSPEESFKRVADRMLPGWDSEKPDPRP